MTVESWYDRYADRQVTVGVTDRHRRILDYLVRFGLDARSTVLELGCGVGALSRLIARRLDSPARLTAVDISSRSLEMARERSKRYPGIRWVHGDVLTVALEGTFDWIVLADLMEHVPPAERSLLVTRAASWLRPAGHLLVNTPFPPYLADLQRRASRSLQVIDEPVWPSELGRDAKSAGLEPIFLEPYSIWVEPYDYMVAVLRRPTSWEDTGFAQKRNLLLRARWWLQRQVSRAWR